jgi:hypothetical protein
LHCKNLQWVPPHKKRAGEHSGPFRILRKVPAAATFPSSTPPIHHHAHHTRRRPQKNTPTPKKITPPHQTFALFLSLLCNQNGFANARKTAPTKPLRGG